MAGWTFDAYSIARNYLHQGLQLTVRLNCSISMGFIKQFHQLDKVARQKVSPLTIALKKKKLTECRTFTVFIFCINVKI